MTPFGKHIEKSRLSPKEVSEQLKVTRAYVHMLVGGSTTPSLRKAWEIEVWSKGAVKMQSWIEFMDEQLPRKKKVKK